MALEVARAEQCVDVRALLSPSTPTRIGSLCTRCDEPCWKPRRNDSACRWSRVEIPSHCPNDSLRGTHDGGDRHGAR